MEDGAMEEFSDIDTTGKPNAVVVGLAPSKFHYEKVRKQKLDLYASFIDAIG